MIKNLLELYGELESAKNNVSELISLLKSNAEPDVILKRVYEFISYWNEIGFDKINLNFNILLQRKMFDLNAQITDMTYYLDDYNVGEISLQNLFNTLLNKFELIFQMITDIQSMINKFDYEQLYSNALLKAKFDELLRDYRMIMRIISPMIKLDYVDLERALNLRGYSIQMVHDFINDFVTFANAVGIEIIPQTIYALINPLHQKQSYKQYMQKLKEIENWFDSMFAEIRARLKNE